MKRLFLIIISLCLASCWQSYATPQMGDILIWEGESWEMNGISPFEFMEKDDYKLIQDLVERRGEKVHEVLKELEYDPHYHIYSDFSTGCYRGYVGYWTIEGGYLYLDHIEFINENLNYNDVGNKAVLKLYPQFVHEGRIRADWVVNRMIMLKVRSYEDYDLENHEYINWKHHQRFMLIGDGQISFSRQFGDNRAEKNVHICKLLEEYLPLYFSCYPYWEDPGKYQATIKIRQEIDSSILDNSFPDDHYFMNCDLVRLSDDAASKVLEVEKYPDYLIDIILKTPWETSFVCGGALFKKESCGRWFYKKTKGSPENRFLSQGDVIVYEIPDPEKLSAKVFRKRPKR